MEEIKKAIEMLNNLCHVILDMPCGCDCCPYQETMDADTGECEVYDVIAKLKDKKQYWDMQNNRAYEQGRSDALDDFRKRINDFLHDSTDFADFVVTDGAIDCVIDELKEDQK